jgi:hypothetical protein
MSNLTLKSMLAASLLLVGANTASAGTDAVRAEAFFNAISGGNAETVTSFYADKAEFHWVGGPLAGIYKGKGQIKAVWERFGQAAGKLDYKTLAVSESQNGPISTVTARVKFIGPKEVPVKFVLMFKDGKIVNQIWQVDKGEGYTAAKAPEKDPAPEGNLAQKAETPKGEQLGKVAATDETAEAAPPLPEAENGAPNEPEGAPEVTEGAPGPNADDGREGTAQGPDGATVPGAEAGSESVAPPAGLAPPIAAEPKKKVVKKVEKKKKYEPDYYDQDYGYGHYEPRGYYRRHHRGYGYGHGSGYGGY